MNDLRPNPDDLLRHAETEERSSGRGRLKLYLGMAAGAGKTFAMLSDALVEQKRGRKIVAAYIEPHGRSDTEDLAKQLPMLAPRVVEYRGVSLRELDLDLALAQQNGTLLVDELAHTNAPGSRHAKRYQDIEELCAKGLNVWTTLNVQHIESLREVVSSITGVEVQESVPDSILSRADEIELVDVSPEELLERLEGGKIYAAEKVDSALRNFFKKSNLVALREIVLRHVADTVDAQLRSFRSSEGVREVWATNPRVLVSLAPSKFAPRLVHAAARLARNLKAPLVAVTVETPRTKSATAADRDHLRGALESAERIGAEVVHCSGHDVVEEILKIARQTNSTIIVAGKPMRSRFREFISGSVADTLIRRSGKIDVHVVQGSSEEGMHAPATHPSSWPRASALLEALFWVAVATAICMLISPWLALPNLVMIYLLAVTWVASRLGRTEAVGASILSVLSFDFCFVEPRWTFAVADFQYFITFSVMLVVALLISTLTLSLKAQSLVATDREQSTRMLFDFSRALGECRTPRELARIAQITLLRQLGFESVLLWPEGQRELQRLNETSAFSDRDQNEMAVAKWVVDRGLPAGWGTSTLPAARGHYLPLEPIRGRFPVWAIFPAPQSQPHAVTAQIKTLGGLAHLLSGTIRRLQLEQESSAAHSKVQQEELKNLLLSSVSHDLRTPLTAICGAASAQLDDPSISERTRQLGATIMEAASRLSMMVRNVLDLTRLESGAVVLNRDWHPLEEIVAVAVRRTEELLRGKSINIRIPPNLPLLSVDGLLLEQLFVNLLENIARHASAASAVEISGRHSGKSVEVEVADNGPGLELGTNVQIFEKLVRGKSSHGFGLGLAICRTIAEAHGGTITASNRPSGGALFVLTLPLQEAPSGGPHEQ
ncbi:MAG: sensor histidine kinase KdpD [Oligoflexia bacterium]|nr:sensor histidine kinase KdpD [Oligoflexia bacterium]